jgi:hypothetical protein
MVGQSDSLVAVLESSNLAGTIPDRRRFAAKAGIRRAGSLGRLIRLVFFRSSESLLVVRDLGVQIDRRSAAGVLTSQFFGKAAVQQVFINEAPFRYHTILSYLALQVDGQSDLVIVFEHTRPRLATLIHVYRSVMALLYGIGDEAVVAASSPIADSSRLHSRTSVLQPSVGSSPSQSRVLDQTDESRVRFRLEPVTSGRGRSGSAYHRRSFSTNL